MGLSQHFSDTAVSNNKIPYYMANRLLWKWARCEGIDGCEIVRETKLSMDQAPPPLPAPPEPARRSVKRLTHKDRVNKSLDDLLPVAEALARFKKWLDTPDAPKHSEPAPTAEREKKQAIAPLDIQEIPGAMRKLSMPVSARLMERWFAGALNYSPTDKDEALCINQDGQPYPADMYDMRSIKLEWILNYPRAKAQYLALQQRQRLTTPRAVEALRKCLSRVRTPGATIDALSLCNGNLVELHNRFQFQFAGVESTFGQKLDEYLLKRLTNSGIPDDLTGALGSFNIYAAVAYAEFNREARRATVTSIYLYVRDNYTFSDKSDNQSQYLGHWNHKRVVLVPAAGAAGIASLPWLDYPVVVEGKRSRDNIYYPVRNKSFREWQQRHRRGGDFIIFSDYRCVTLPQPIEIVFS
ncbi:hypothetical protein NA66_1012133 [Burkholderia pyrrocinia]|uniref:Uncharacterized protein n=1 Tax=Burkholderia pyrrocinia TaxID=60550 RepID=A0A318ILE1_BURPY|nr:hypothetical protein NA66_1012133 [Burkholderia pyrrocinia]SFW43532.1 hypothetical protein SAMN03159384_02056 [Burkholderia sp. NFACC33-1]SFX74830.1 hypothetical protein SAMN03159408_02138 [Burkholderia sp. NFPP32]